MRNLFVVFFLFLCLILVSCAQIVNPNGGERDLTAPKLLNVSPKNLSTNFTKNNIQFKFNEFIQLNNPGEQIIISPPLENKPEYINKGRLLEIRFKESLLPNTTYTINFGNAIGDNKENNLVKDFVYVLSTGNIIDSNYISGKVENAFTNKPENDITVGLYYTTGFNDSTVIKNKPIYMAKTNENGLFNIKNLPENNFKIIAFKDENKNLKKEVNEPIAFLNNIINSTDSNNKNLTLKLFNPNLYKPGRVIDTFNRDPDKFVFVIYKPSNVSIKPKNSNKYYLKYIKGNQDIDTFYLFTSTIKTDSLLKFNALINNQNNELIIKQRVVNKINKPTFSITRQLELNDTIKINFVNPIIKIDTSRIKLLKDSIKLTYKLLQINNFELQVIYPKEESTTYKLLLNDSAFLDYYNQYSKQEKAVYVMKNKKEYGNLILHVKVPKNNIHPYLLQLLSSDEKMVHYQFTITNNLYINLDNVIPGIYKVKYIYDSNGNGIWDTGDLNTNTQPEKVKYLDQLLTLKAYWDLEQSVLIE